MMQRYDYPVQIIAFSADIVDTFTCTDFESGAGTQAGQENA